MIARRAVSPFTLASALLLACSDDAPPSARLVRPAPTATPEGPSLSAAFGTNCARCHGAQGGGSDQAPALPGTLDESAFLATVRAGRGRTMPAFDERQIADADLKADYAALKAAPTR